ncbi:MULTISPECIES: hypothetical protein [Roseivirga]|jgi:hypothetical protein|uniref:DUF4382 domain-containing protein n=1 Tax=Roseivirga spongicola TaxID=333140 RepID=A0A150WYZ5_9BACT|nr:MULTISPECIES: hypothetical protein [Roseivirga]KYG71512.1 hypothetical protein AWW68_18380 [Roseivirga spongicola]MBO6495069.1 hypothetical protein [Roseivirga sp.]WPZ08910.1 hypothetical protein T7867_11655 [Roseivirga spongicola]
MKKLILSTFALLLVLSCSDEPAPFEAYPQTHDIRFTIEASDKRGSEIDLDIEGDNLDISWRSSSNDNLPLDISYPNTTVAYLTIATINYRDLSEVQVGVPFEPYTIKMTIRVDDEIVESKEVTISESGQVDFVNYSFQ